MTTSRVSNNTVGGSNDTSSKESGDIFNSSGFSLNTIEEKKRAFFLLEIYPRYIFIATTDMEKLFAVLSMYTVLGAVMCAPLPGIEPSPSVGELQSILPVLDRILHRSARQLNPNRQQVIDNVFQIPIATLTAVSSLLQSTRPIFPSATNNQGQTAAPATAPASVFAGHGAFHRRQTLAARVAQVNPAADGSSFKI
ncbi:hypothetical protein L798_05904 [Zootermopsis nevadensis]|uniref:Uncharacterized protein n=1 Tax=Zootermopsis nevadensis TaxID=136037 RepID=A0A067RAQ7_ZOONE|nr:hypothetical protein L798_05904 [Zootermopsis nevadensis]